jgi:excinuclease ABC subunit C
MINAMKEQTEIRKRLHATALDAPKTSGVYLWKDETGLILYVGKAKSLKNRLSSYFASNKDIKTRILVSRAHAIEYITTENEYEALLLENTLIKKHSPKYNINLKDGKTYPVIKITKEPFPRVYRTRRIQNDGARYFGPFPNVTALDQFLELVKRNYTFRQCRVLRKRAVPCLYYHIGRCSAPCCGKVSEEAYSKDLEELYLLLDGDTESSIRKLETVMKEAASAMQFEKAARIRDGIRSIRQLREQNAVVDMDPESRDYIAWAAEGTMVTFAIIQMRSGRLTGRDLFRVRSLKEEEEILPEFLMAYYTSAAHVPPRIFVPTESGLSLAEEWFEKGLGISTRISVVSDSGAQDDETKRHSTAMAMAAFNAREDARRRLRETGDFPALEELRSLLALPSLPSRIEGFDIAHIGGRLPVASLITFADGNPDRKNYRMFRLRTTDGVIDDFASMREVTTRRYSRLINEGADLPDLLLIDGGIGQVNAVKGVLDALGADIPVIGLAKQDEEIYLPGNSQPLRLPRRSDALRLLQRIRDETHRFATTRNQRLRTKENTTLLFESLPGIGPKKAVLLLKNFGSPEKMAAIAKTNEGIELIAKAAQVDLPAAQLLADALDGLLAERLAERARRAETGANKETPEDISTLARMAGNAGLPQNAAEAAERERPYTDKPSSL